MMKDWNHIKTKLVVSFNCCKGAESIRYNEDNDERRNILRGKIRVNHRDKDDKILHEFGVFM